MQARRRNPDRSDATREALVAAARRLFAEKGYAATGTPEIVAAARVTRGALYHHYADKADLFRAVVEREHAAVAAEIEAASPSDEDAITAIIAGGEAFLDGMADPGRRRILLVDAPAVLGPEEIAAINARHGGRTLVEGVSAGVAAGALRPLPATALADLLAAAFDRAALAVGSAAEADLRRALRGLVAGLAAPAAPGG
jgi:AcrR family transcriptional regulator